MAIHLCHTHPQNARQLIPKSSISDKEKSLMKAKWESIQKTLNSHCRYKKPKGKKDWHLQFQMPIVLDLYLSKFS